MRRRLLPVLMLIVVASPATSAQSVGRMLGNDLRWMAQDVGAVWLSPFKGDAGDYALTAGVVGGSAALSVLDDDVDRLVLANRDRGLFNAVRPMRHGGSFYTAHRAVPVAGVAYVVALLTKNRGLRDGIMGCAASYTAGSTLRRLVLYNVLGRDRPDTARNRPAGEASPPSQSGDQYHFSIPARSWGAQSFPGGHVENAAACASFFMYRYDTGVIGVPLVGLVSGVGLARLADRGHWLSDQVIGVAMGWAVGKEVARRQLHRLADERSDSPASLYRDGGPLTPSDYRPVIAFRLTF